MNIILDKSLKTDSKQPKVFNLGQITTTLQDLLDNSTIVINGEQIIILSIIDENNNVLKYLLPLDYKGESFYGLGKEILESNLISLSGNNLNFQQVTDAGPITTNEVEVAGLILNIGNGRLKILNNFGQVDFYDIDNSRYIFEVSYAQLFFGDSSTGNNVQFNKPASGQSILIAPETTIGSPETIATQEYVANKLPKIINNFTNDAAAAIGGIAVGNLYHTAGVVKIRLT